MLGSREGRAAADCTLLRRKETFCLSELYTTWKGGLLVVMTGSRNSSSARLCLSQRLVEGSV